MKRLGIMVIAIMLAFSFAYAQEDVEVSEEEVQVTPDHPLYAAKKAAEKGVIRLSPNASEEAKARVDAASRRAVESKKMADAGKNNLSEDAAEEYAEEMLEISNMGSEISDLAQKRQIDELVARATQFHTEVLGKVYEKVPAQAKSAIEGALNQSLAGHQKSIDSLKQRGALPADIEENIPSNLIPAGVKIPQWITLGKPQAGKP